MSFPDNHSSLLFCVATASVPQPDEIPRIILRPVPFCLKRLFESRFSHAKLDAVPKQR